MKPLSDQERVQRVEAGARTLEEIDPFEAKRLKHMGWIGSTKAIVIALVIFLYTVGVLFGYEKLFRIEETAPAEAAPALEQVSPGPVTTCPPDPASPAP